MSKGIQPDMCGFSQIIIFLFYLSKYIFDKTTKISKHISYILSEAGLDKKTLGLDKNALG